MVTTPWGDSDSLRARRLRPGPGSSAADVERNQRERLFAAMVASVSERGYAATTLTHLTELSGVSRRTLYVLFADKEACFAASVEAMLARGADALIGDLDPGWSWEETMRERMARFARLLVDQAPAAKLCLIEAYVAGPNARRPIEEAISSWERVIAGFFAEDPERERLPEQMIAALVGATLGIAGNRLRQGQEAELPTLFDEMIDLALSYRAPTEALRIPARSRKAPREELSGADKRERALGALMAVAAEKGYRELAVNDVLARASMSPTTFYAHFTGKEDAMGAAIESAGAQVIAAAMPAFRRHRYWSDGVRNGAGAMLSFLASRPALANLLLVEAYAAGPDALARRDQALRQLEGLLAPGRVTSPGAVPILAWPLAEAAYALAYRQMREHGSESLPTLTPILTYLVLAPYLGAEEASAAANDEGPTRRSATGEIESVATVAAEPVTRRVMTYLSSRAARAEDVAGDLGEPLEVVRDTIAELEGEGLVEATGAASAGLYRSSMRTFDEDQWQALSSTERAQISAQILSLVFGEVEIAMEQGSYDARSYRHLSRVEGEVDEQGWRALMELHDETLDAGLDVIRESGARLRASAKKGLSVRTVQMVFEMPE